MGNNTTFKPSPLGPIPSDWEVRKFQDFAKFFSGGTPLTSIPEYYFGEIPFIKSGEIYFDKTEQFISEEGLKNSSAKLVVKGDLLYALYGANSGEVAISQINGAINQAILCIRHNSNCNTLFIYNFLLSQKESIIRNYLQGGQGNLSAEIVKSLPIPLPPLPEQRAIAACLSTWDNAITKVQAQLAQKELRKKWLMQQLLTGKKRLKGFSEEWKEITIGDNFEFIRSYSISRDGLDNSEVKNPIYCIHYGDIHAFYETDFLDFSKQSGIPQIADVAHIINNDDFLKDGDVIIADASEDYEGVAEAVTVINLHDKTAVGGLHTIVLRGDPKVVANEFRGYLFSSETVRNKLRKLATGTSVYSVSRTTLGKLIVKIPASLEEQKSISQVLLNADKEIQLLKAKTDKLKEEKKGLMQQLLTGKKRLIK